MNISRLFTSSQSFSNGAQRRPQTFSSESSLQPLDLFHRNPETSKIKFSGQLKSKPRSPKVTSIEMGETGYASSSNEVLKTTSLMSCSAIVYLGDYDKHKGLYQTRILSHIPGSSLYSKVSGDEAGQLISLMISHAQKDPSARAQIIHGFENSSNFSKDITMTQDYRGRQPFMELENLLKERFSSENGIDVEVHPDGEIVIPR